MDKFEEKLLSIETPDIEDNFLKYDLKEKLEKKYFKTSYHKAYRVALSSAFMLLVVSMSFVVKPDLANKINVALLGKDETSKVTQEQVQVAKGDDWKGFEGLAEVAKSNPSQNDKSQFQMVSDEDVKTINFIKPDDFEEGKVYMIRRYKSEDTNGIILINELNDNPAKGKIKKM